MRGKRQRHSYTSDTLDLPNPRHRQQRWLRTAANREQFKPIVIYPSEGWRWEPASKPGGGKESMTDIVTHQYGIAYDRLADGIEKTAGFNDNLVRKVSADAIRDELKSRGFLDSEGAKGGITALSRKYLYRAKAQLLKTGKLVEKDGFLWRP
jgi:hypothetical protein